MTNNSENIPLQKEPDAASGRQSAVTWRSILIGLIILPFNDYWQVQMEIIRYSAHPSTISLFFNTVFILLVLTVINQGVKRIRPAIALQRAELLLIYTMLCIGSAVVGHDTMEILVPMLTWPFRHATTSNNWVHVIIPHLRKPLFVIHKSIYLGYYLGDDTIFRMKYILAWLPVVCIWTLFLSTLLAIFLCMNAILRKQWTDNERLTYPIIQVPLQITQEGAFDKGGLFRNRLFWMGFLIAGTIDMVNSLNYYYPNIPTILTPGFGQSFLDISIFFTHKPWNAIGWTPVSFYPFMIGLGMFMPLDFLFSMWFFYWFWKLQHVTASAMAWDRTPDFPYTENQSYGAYLSFCFYSIWLSRSYLKQVVLRALGRPSTVDDTDEPMSYRTALLGILTGMCALVAFSVYIGMVWWIAVLFFVMYLGLALAITRMRAELGTPIHDLHFTGPDQVMTRIAGSRAFSPDTLTAFSLYFWFTRAYRGHPMPIQLEGYKMAEQTRTSYKRWNIAMLCMGSIAVFIGFWVILQLMYHYGAEAKSTMTFGAESYNQLQSWITTPSRGSFGQLMAVFVGLGFAAFLQYMRIRFPWWPFHPLAYAVSSSYEINLVWGPLFLAWIFKSLLLRYSGRGGFQKALPFFIGLMLGQFVVGSLWNIYGIARGLPTYQFWQ